MPFSSDAASSARGSSKTMAAMTDASGTLVAGIPTFADDMS